MARPTSITNEQILDAARAVFLEQGAKASTAMIAKRAGVSEGTIFKRYPSKEHLFREAMGLPDFDLERRVEPRIGRGDMKEQLTKLETEIIEFFRELLPRMMMICTQPGFDPVSFNQRDPMPGPMKLLRAVSGYLEREAELGRLRAKDPEVIARILIGSAHNFVFLELIRGDLRARSSASAFARTLVGALWEGIAPAKRKRGRT